MTEISEAQKQEFGRLVTRAYEMSSEVGSKVEEILKEGLENPFSDEELVALLNELIETMREGAEARGDKVTSAQLNTDLTKFITDIVASRKKFEQEQLDYAETEGSKVRVELKSLDGIDPHPVRPTPTFHENPIPINEGFVNVRDIKLWDENDRIDIHLAQFMRANGRKPTSHELLDIMLSQMDMPGLALESDQFKILDLARSIAVNGVRKPPILDVDGKLLDGNRRVAACYYILNSGDFTAKEKKRAETIIVWQLTEHATDADREAVIVSLNFEPDYKEQWPEYVKARKVYDEWKAMLSREPRANGTRMNEMRKELARKFALGPDTRRIVRYVKMVEMADEFEDYHVIERQRDTFEVKHSAERHFQYFDELTKGTSGGVHYSLNQDDTFKHLVFDLLYPGKFNNWREIRSLKHFPGNDDAMLVLRRARDEEDTETAQDLVEQAVGVVNAKRADQRQLGANSRIEIFVKWLEELPVKAFQPGEPGSITTENLKALHKALKLIEGYFPAEG